MGEAVVSSEVCMELEVKEAETETQIEDKMEEIEGDDDGSTAPATSSVVRWERFLPRMVLRVLLVEADDSTRQIIAALLRKCSYRVAAVPDGLKAWEVLKGRPHDIDLILTEVELPSISGFALLTLITEHEICKNIPVIMMSSHDSVSTVYKCMMRGAADFLVKPVRKNELRNLWQHVWRRQASGDGGLVPLDESVVQPKVEASAENNATSNHSSGFVASIQGNRECIEKGSDAQSSCGKPDLEAEEEVHRECMQDHSYSRWSKSILNDMNMQKVEDFKKSSEKLLMQENGAEAEGANTLAKGKDMHQASRWAHANAITQACSDDHVFANVSKEAIDLIGAFDIYRKCSDFGSNNAVNNVDSSPLLNLSLRRSNPSVSVNQITDERQKLNHSDGSAFSRYVNRAMHPQLLASPRSCNQQKENEANDDKQFHCHTQNKNCDIHGPTLISEKNMLALTTGPLGQAEIAFSCPKRRVFPVPIPIGDTRFQNLSAAPHSSIMLPIFSAQPSLSAIQSPGSGGHQEPSCQAYPFYASDPETRNSQQLHNLMGKNANNVSDQNEHKQGHKLDSLEDRGHLSSATDPSAGSSFCNGAASHLNSFGCTSNCKVNTDPVGRTTVECGNEYAIPDGISCRSMQREAALTKFRLKRKDRCFEKKVRYESRKKLAEQRPRVKGQFVRQAQTGPPHIEIDNL